MRKCTRCGHKNDDVNFCSFCGCDLRTRPSGRPCCPYCGANQNNAENVYCCKCGKQIKGRKKRKYIWIILSLAIVTIGSCLLIFKKTTDDIPQETTCQHEWENNGVMSICTKCRGVIITPSDNDSSPEMGNQSVTSELVTAQKNQMSRDFIPPVPQELNQDASGNRGYLRSITFVDTLEHVPSEHISDVSAAQDGSVLAWYEIEEDTGIRELYIAANGNILAPENSEALFSCNYDLEEIRFNNCFDTSLVTNMRDMFGYCEDLRELDLSSFDTSKVTDMSWMFHKKFSLQKLDLSTFDTSSVKTMVGMFSLSAIEEVDLSSFDTSNVTSMSGMFEKCGALTALDISNFVTSSATDTGGMFYQCSSLEMLDISSFDLSGIPQEDIATWLFMDSECPKLFITNANLNIDMNCNHIFEVFNGKDRVKTRCRFCGISMDDLNDAGIELPHVDCEHDYETVMQTNGAPAYECKKCHNIMIKPSAYFTELKLLSDTNAKGKTDDVKFGTFHHNGWDWHDAVRFWVADKDGYTNMESFEVYLARSYTSLEAIAFADHESDENANMKLRFYGDGELLCEITDITKDVEEKSARIDISDIEVLKIECSTATNAFGYCVLQGIAWW